MAATAASLNCSTHTPSFRSFQQGPLQAKLALAPHQNRAFPAVLPVYREKAALQCPSCLCYTANAGIVVHLSLMKVVAFYIIEGRIQSLTWAGRLLFFSASAAMRAGEAGCGIGETERDADAEDASESLLISDLLPLPALQHANNGARQLAFAHCSARLLQQSRGQPSCQRQRQIHRYSV